MKYVLCTFLSVKLALPHTQPCKQENRQQNPLHAIMQVHEFCNSFTENSFLQNKSILFNFTLERKDEAHNWSGNNKITREIFKTSGMSGSSTILLCPFLHLPANPLHIHLCVFDEEILAFISAINPLKSPLRATASVVCFLQQYLCSHLLWYQVW